MFLHFFFLAAFNKNGSTFDNSTNGTSLLTAPAVPNNFPFSLDNLSMTGLLRNSSSEMRRNADEDKESGTATKTLNHTVEELTTSGLAKLHGMAAAFEKISNNLFGTAMAKDIRKTDSEKENETTKDNLNSKTSESMTTGHPKSQRTTNSDRKPPSIVVFENTGKLSGDKGIEDSTSGNTSIKPQETAGVVDKVPKNMLFDIFARLVGDKGDQNNPIRNSSEPTSTGNAKTQETINMVSNMTKSSSTDTTLPKSTETLAGEKGKVKAVFPLFGLDM